LGFERVYHYAAGKLDWKAAGLPIEGELAARPTAGQFARADVPTCRVDEPMATVRDRAKEAGCNACVVVNEERVVFGLLRSKELARGRDEPVERFMRPGPSTFRPHVPIVEMAVYMFEHNVESSPITTSDGRLVGLLLREDAEREVHRLHEEHLRHHEAEGSDHPDAG